MKNLFIIIPTSTKEQTEYNRKKVKAIAANYPDYNLLNPVNGIARLTKLEKLSKHIKMLSQADIVYLAEGWEYDDECLILKRICDTSNIIKYYECEARSTYGIVQLNHSSINNTVSELIDALIACPSSFDICLDSDNIYDDDMSLGINYNTETVDVSDIRNTFIENDLRYKTRYKTPEEIESNMVHDDDLDEQGVITKDIYPVCITKGNTRFEGELYHKCIFSSQIKDILEYSFDLFYVYGFDSDDIDKPIKITTKKLIDTNGLEYIGMLTIANSMSKDFIKVSPMLYIDGITVQWKIIKR